MKKVSIVVPIISLVMLFCSSLCHAEGLKFTGGLRTWYNDWTVENEADQTARSDYVFLVGPNVKLTYGNFFGGMSVMTTASDYNFPDSKWSRNDLDAVFGYMVHPRIGLVAGWKYLWGSSKTRGSHTVYGPAFGFTFNYPIPIENVALSFYLNAAFMPLKGEYQAPNSSNTPDYNIIGYSAEGGFAYSPFPKFTINLGYKYQNLDWRYFVSDILSGVTLGVSYEF